MDEEQRPPEKKRRKCIIEKIFCFLLGYRYQTIPPLIIIAFAAMIGLSYLHAPDQYKKNHFFHISNLGNWQEGLGFFSAGMITIAVLIFTLAGELLEQRMDDGCDCYKRPCAKKMIDCFSRCCCNSLCVNKIRCVRKFGCVYKFGSAVLFVGLVVTGCFQQSHNKPAHNIGVALLGVGFFIIFVYDMLYYCYCQEEKKRTWFVLQILFAVVALLSGIAFICAHYAAKAKWEAGKEDVLKLRGEDECPGRTEEDRLNGIPYPNYYPCKSKTLWLSDDPGWECYLISAGCEIALFVFLICYSFTYWGFLDANPKGPPKWFPQSQACGYNPVAEDEARGELVEKQLPDGVVTDEV